MKDFYSSFIITIIGLFIAFYLGGIHAVFICSLLSVLEISLSFDNAVVNAKVLDNMDKKWRTRFIYWGIPIAVFGMRFVFPIAIVCIASNMGFFETLYIAMYNPSEYHQALEKNINQIYVFGGAFLLMVFLDFFFDSSREEKWLTWIESNPITNTIMNISNISVLFSCIIGVALLLLTKDFMIGVVYFCALVVYLLLSSISSIMGEDGIRNGLAGFLYLEVLDASFSFDGVIGAFALNSNIFIIMIGLGIGAMFVRSLTIYLVEKKTLQEYIYLEHGAHYAIFALAIIMLLKIFIEVSEVITGLIGIGFIGIAFICSKMKNHKDKKPKI